MPDTLPHHLLSVIYIMLRLVTLDELLSVMRFQIVSASIITGFAGGENKAKDVAVKSIAANVLLPGGVLVTCRLRFRGITSPQALFCKDSREETNEALSPVFHYLATARFCLPRAAKSR